MFDTANIVKPPWESSNAHGGLTGSFRLAPDDKSIHSEQALDGSADSHRLKKPGTRTGLFLRTHFWDDAVERAFLALRKAWADEIFICADTTNGDNFPADKTVFPHSVHSLQKLGLVDLGLHGSMTWYNGDYPIYDITLASDFDYYVLVEYDCLVDCDLNVLVDRFLQAGAEFVAPDFRQVFTVEGWFWEDYQRKADLIDRGWASLPIHKGFFPFIFISRTAALHLFARRLVAARARSGRADAAWPFCESFAATELMRAGFSCQALDHFCGPLPHITVSSAWSWNEIEAGGVSTPFVHPVLSGQRLIDTLALEASVQTRKGKGDELQWLQAAASRNFSNDERELLAQKIAALQTAQTAPDT